MLLIWEVFPVSPGPEVLERTQTPRGEIQLQRRGDHYEIIENGVFLMATYNGESERQLVTRAMNAAENPRRVLIGGLGVGFSLAAALADTRAEQVTVVEIEERLIAWNRTHLAPFSGNALSDPRTRVVHADLVRWARASTEQFDAICLDIDNGPEWTVTDANLSLYDDQGLAALRRLLAPGGALSFWSAAPSHKLAERLSRIFRRVEAYAVEVPQAEPDYVYVAQG
jgi:spermidine synthase